MYDSLLMRSCYVSLIIHRQVDASNCACCWSKDPETGRPLLCVAGNDAKVKVYDIKEGKLANVGPSRCGLDAND